MAAMIGASKNILSNERALTEAEAELMKAMDEQVANEKVKQLQRERRLMSFRAAKNVYTAKIKSKKYHKIKKRSNRRKLVKEFEDLVTKDPEAAKAKLAELEKDRLMERATLRHRTTGKWNKNLIKYAARNEGVKKIMQDHMQFGRELKAKLLGVDPDDLSDSDEEEQTPEVIGNKKKEYQTFLAMVAEEASKEHDKAEKVPDNIASALLDGHNPWLKTGLLKLRSAIKQKEEAKRGFRTQLTKSKAIANMELDDGWTIVGAGQEEYPVTKSDMDADQEGAMKETLSEEESEDEECDGNGKKEDSSIDDIFDAYFNSLIKTTKDEEEAAQRQDDLEALEKAESNYVETAPGLKRKGDQEGPVAAKSAKIDIDISLDPSKYLKLVTSEVDSIDETVNDHLDGQARINAFDQTNIIAEAFEDDDVLVEFEKHKAMVEDFESVKDVDLTLHGWGSWTGQTIAKKSKPEYVLKAPINERKDAKNRGLIMLESVDSAISKLQPTDVPFPYTSSKVFEAVAKQPLGMDWNPATTTKKMTKPVVRTRLGKIIRPISKIETMKGRKVGLDK
uniref:U3 small nucleolar RNA-associated protein 14 homolog A n=1 Tax=Rhabditophanes sp. KR3021 TaxID=114890 RepID=A0AC35TGL7_9BILA